MVFKQPQELGSRQLFHRLFYEVEQSRVEFHIPNSADSLQRFSMAPGLLHAARCWGGGGVVTSQPAPLPSAAVEPSGCCPQSCLDGVGKASQEQTAPRCPAKAPGCKLLGKRVAGCVSNGKQWPSVPWAALQGCSLHICLGISDPGAELHPCPPPAQLWESLSIHCPGG